MGFTESGQPDPAFKEWFAHEWRELHNAVTIPGMSHASWDRKAAYLLWLLYHDEHFDLQGPHFESTLKYVRDKGNEPPMTGHDLVAKSVGWGNRSNGKTTLTFATPAVVGPEPIVGNGPHQRATLLDSTWSDVIQNWDKLINPVRDAACLPLDGGVPFQFNSAKW